MPTQLVTEALEKSTYVVTVGFRDENGDACDPVTLTWTLTDRNGNVVNSREEVVVNAPTSVTQIVLQGDDLDPAEGLRRYLAVEGTYDSDLGSGLPFKDEVMFMIRNLVAV